MDPARKRVPVVMEPSGVLMEGKNGQNSKPDLYGYSVPPDSTNFPLSFHLFRFAKNVELEVPLQGRECVTVGRRSSGKSQCDVEVDAGLASKCHLVFQARERSRRQTKVYVLDLGSTNGTFLASDAEEEPVKVPAKRYVELRDGDRIRLGDPKADEEFVVVYH